VVVARSTKIILAALSAGRIRRFPGERLSLHLLRGRYVKAVSMSVYGAVGALVYGVLAFAIVALAAYVFV
jgi:hypothetical protein